MNAAPAASGEHLKGLRHHLQVVKKIARNMTGLAQELINIYVSTRTVVVMHVYKHFFLFFVNLYDQWRRGNELSSHNFRLWENCQIFLLSKICQNACRNFELKHTLGNRKNKIEIFSTHDFLCRKFSAFCRKKMFISDPFTS